MHDDPVRPHYIADQVFGTPIDLGRRVVTGHDYSDQDANRTARADQPRQRRTTADSPAVASYTSPDVNLYRGTPGVFNEDGRPVRIVYLVRGRNPSSQDGLWIATITKDDRQ